MIVIIAGSNRTGTSYIAEILVNNGGYIPNIEKAKLEYNTYEDKNFKGLTKELIKNRYNKQKLLEFKMSLPKNKLIILKYPKASLVINKWLEIFPNAKYIYVLRNPAKSLWKSVSKFGHYILPLWFKYWKEYNKGYNNMINIRNLYIISFERLLKYKKEETNKLLRFIYEARENEKNKF